MSFFLIQNIIAFLIPFNYVQKFLILFYHYFIYKSSKTIGSSFFLEKFSFVKLKAVGVFFKEESFYLLTLR